MSGEYKVRIIVTDIFTHMPSLEDAKKEAEAFARDIAKDFMCDAVVADVMEES